MNIGHTGKKVDCVECFLRLLAHKMHETTTFLLVTLPKIRHFKKVIHWQTQQ